MSVVGGRAESGMARQQYAIKRAPDFLRFSLGRKEMSRASLKLSGLLADEAATAKCGVIHQIDKAHIAFIKRIMTGWCTGRLCLLAELSVHSEPLLEYDTPIAG
jgi:hypothetical protein